MTKVHYSVVFSPDDGGYWAYLWRDQKRASPIYPTPEKAHAWARKRGGNVPH